MYGAQFFNNLIDYNGEIGAVGVVSQNSDVIHYLLELHTCTFGGKPLRVAPSKQGIVTPDSDKPGNMAQITIVKQAGDALKPFCVTRWPAKVDYRGHLILLQKGDGNINTFVMPDYPPFH